MKRKILWQTRRRHVASGIFLFVLILPFQVLAVDEYSFDLKEFEDQNLKWGGYLEGKWEHSALNREGALTVLNDFHDLRSTRDIIGATVQLDGSYKQGMTSLNWVAQVTGSQDESSWQDQADIFEAYASIKINPGLSLDAGKKTFKWGKGYAWNPVGFIDRPKDPNNPEDAMEGYIGTGLDLVKSYDGPLQTVALTTVALPVWQEVNEDFGARDNLNLAAKLYLLYLDTDIDLVGFTGNSRSTRYGVDFSRNLATNFEIHGELAHIPKQRQIVCDALTGLSLPRERSDTSYLLGLRYLTENDMTTIVEFYHNDDGYTEAEQEDFFRLIDRGYAAYLSNGDSSLLHQASRIGQSGYLAPQSGRDYLYTRITWKEPYDILYFTPGVTAIVNTDDQSFSVSPETVYTGFTNWELRLRFSWLQGQIYSEYGEKQNSNKVEFRVRYFW
ncbi:MAG: hypothetical protein Q7U64_14960 [Desulfocapsaceae bacterium]|nr:hypothetical protein [Desulfocapsaceae bacterium]